MAFAIKKPHKGTETKWYRVFCYPVTIFEIKKPHKGTETSNVVTITTSMITI